MSYRPNANNDRNNNDREHNRHNHRRPSSHARNSPQNHNYNNNDTHDKTPAEKHSSHPPHNAHSEAGTSHRSDPSRTSTRYGPGRGHDDDNRSGKNGERRPLDRGATDRRMSIAGRRPSTSSDGKRIIVFSKSRYKIYEHPKQSEFGRALNIMRDESMPAPRSRTKSIVSNASQSSSLSLRGMDFSRKSIMFDLNGEHNTSKLDESLPTHFRSTEGRSGDIKKKYFPSTDRTSKSKFRKKVGAGAGARTKSMERSEAWSRPRLSWLDKIERESPVVDVLTPQKQKEKMKKREICCCPFSTAFLFFRKSYKEEEYFQHLDQSFKSHGSLFYD